MALKNKKMLKWYIVLAVVIGVLLGYTIASGVSVIGMAKGGNPGKPGGKPSFQCSDNIDNDGDGFCDFAWKKAKCNDGSTPGDDGCSSKDDNDETNCGDGVCEVQEICDVCVADCGTCTFCGDGICSGTETCSNCQQDCGPCDSCSDSDGGYIIGTQGTTSGFSEGSPYSFSDSCNDDILIEWYCSGSQATNFPYSCPNNSTNGTLGCLNGACV